jgi:hypothetical protein
MRFRVLDKRSRRDAKSLQVLVGQRGVRAEEEGWKRWCIKRICPCFSSASEGGVRRWGVMSGGVRTLDTPTAMVLNQTTNTIHKPAQLG